MEFSSLDFIPFATAITTTETAVRIATIGLANNLIIWESNAFTADFVTLITVERLVRFCITFSVVSFNPIPLAINPTKLSFIPSVANWVASISFTKLSITSFCLRAASEFSPCIDTNSLYNLVSSSNFFSNSSNIEETLFHPSFSPKIIEEIKLNYQDRVIRYLDKPGNLLNERTKEELAKDHRLFHDQCGDKRYLLAKTDLIKVQKAYEHLLNDAKISVYVLGNVTEADFMDLKKWGLSTRDDILFDLSPVRLKEHGYVEYQKDISQAYLRIVYNCDTQSDPANYFKRLVANTILGSGPSSRLFKIVREENSLCYSIYSLIKRSEGLAEIVAAASYVHIAKMCSLIDKIITDLGDKGPKEEELMVAKTYLINALNANDDTAKNIIDHLIANDIYQTDLTLHDYIEFIKQVTWDDVKGIVSAYRKKGTFVLRGLDDEKNR